MQEANKIWYPGISIIRHLRYQILVASSLSKDLISVDFHKYGHIYVIGD